MTDDITLPPLPLPDHAGPNGTGTYFSAWTETQVRDAQRAAVLLDRQQRAAPSAEPVAWRYKPMIGSPWSMSDDGYYISCKRDAGYIIEALAVVQPAPSAEPVAAALRFPGDARLCLSTVFDTVKEARDFADTRTSGAVVEPLCLCKPVPSAEPALDKIEQYRMQMAGICTAALGYWKDGDSIHPDYDTPALREVARLYAKYRELHDATPPAPSAEPPPAAPTGEEEVTRLVRWLTAPLAKGAK